MTQGQRIKKLREELGLTQDDLAKRVGYKTRSAINKIETNNSREVPPSKLQIFAKALNCSVSYLMGWEDEESPELLAELMADSESIEIAKLFSKLNDTNKDFVRSTIEMLIKKQEDV